jgi:hypothetical protein
MAAAAAACAPDQYKIVERAAVAQLPDASEERANSIAVALALLPPEQVSLPVELLASHPSQWVRSLAAVIWAQRADQADEIGVQLAQDASYHVRMSLARSLGGDSRHAKVRTVLAEDPRRSVRWQVNEPRRDK